jgi:hypothetical protein
LDSGQPAQEAENMNSFRMRSSVVGLAMTALTTFVGLSGVEHQHAVPQTVSTTPGSVWLADSDQDQLNEMDQQQAEETAQQAQDTAAQEQATVDQQNAFNESMTAGNS